jgi:replicative DNA helicase
LVDLVTLIAFWKRKETTPAPASERIIPLPAIPGVSAESIRATSQEAANQARDALKVLKLEMQILGTALTTIYESHSKGLINQAERDRLLEKYKVDLASLEKAIKENQRLVDLFDLESEREQLVRNFKSTLAEIDAQVKTLTSGGTLNHPQKTGHDDEKSGTETNVSKKTQTGQEQSVKKSSESQQLQITDAEKRIEQIRAEILQAMDRLEQIESEG